MNSRVFECEWAGKFGAICRVNLAVLLADFDEFVWVCGVNSTRWCELRVS